MSTLGVFGGTFNPVHFGHLRSALELKQAFHLEQVRMIPCSNPPHRDQPSTSAEHRFAMLELALSDAGVEGLVADDRELKRPELSYTFDTLLSLQRDFPDKSLLLFVGSDAFSDFTGWHRWESILSLANLVVMTRPGEAFSSSAIELLNQRRVASLEILPPDSVGHIVNQCLTQIDISSTAIRLCYEKQQDPSFLLPSVVMRYILKHKLY